MPLINTLNTFDNDPQIYNLYDCCRTHEILPKLLDLQSDNTIYTFSLGLQAPAMDMMLTGFRVDPLKREEAIASTKFKLENIDKALNLWSNSIWGKDLNYNSGPQIKELLYDHMFIERIKKWHKGIIKEPMDRDTLEKLHEKYELIRPLTGAIMACRDLNQQLERLEYEVDDDWRMRYSNNIVGTNEGRWSTSKSFIGTGGNMQNIDPALRSMFISDDGYKLFGFDKEQAEARWVGFYCGVLFNDWSYLDALESGDGHTAVARMVWSDSLPWTGDIKKDREIAESPFGNDTYRQACKILAHATNILGKPPTISSHTKIPIPLIESFQDRYFSAFPILKWHTWLANKIQSSQFLINAFGRRRDFFDRPNADETIRKGAAFMQASSNADDINLGILKTWAAEPELQLLTQEHDALYLQAPETMPELEVVERVKNHLTIIFDLGFRKFSVPIDCKTGWNKGMRWRKNPDGSFTEVNPRGLDKPGAKRNATSST